MKSAIAFLKLLWTAPRRCDTLCRAVQDEVAEIQMAAHFEKLAQSRDEKDKSAP